jgi:hypothetical protein
MPKVCLTCSKSVENPCGTPQETEGCPNRGGKTTTAKEVKTMRPFGHKGFVFEDPVEEVSPGVGRRYLPGT